MYYYRTAFNLLAWISISVNNNGIVISIDEDPSLRIEIFAMINLRGVSTKLYFKEQFDYQEE